MHELEVVLALLAAVVVLAALANRIRVAYPIVLIIGGMILGAAPFVPLLTLDPDLVLLVLLAPALFSAAVALDWRASRTQQRPILELAIRLVLTTTIGVAVVAMLVIGGMDWGPAFVLGAIVSPPDAVATISVVRGLKLPGNLITILEGESLVNDATALVLYRVAVAAVVTGSFSPLDAAGQFVLVASVGIAIGLAMGWTVYGFLRYVSQNAEISVAVSLLTPVAAYLIAEESGVSGVLAVVAAGLVTARKTLPSVTSQTRLQLLGVWGLVSFLTEGFAFVLIGLQLPFVLDGIEGQSVLQLIWYAVAIIATTVLIRVVWVFWEIGGHLIAPTGDAPLWGSTSTRDRWANLLSGFARLLGHQRAVRLEQRPTFRGATVIAWSGLRGLVTLATALALPYTTDDGQPFPQRDLIIYLAFCVILTTLVGQGGTLPSLIRRLRFPDDPVDDQRFRSVLTRVFDAGVLRLEELRTEGLAEPEVADRLMLRLERRREAVQSPRDGRDGLSADDGQSVSRLIREVEESERSALRDMAATGEISESLRRRLEQRIDLQQVGRERLV